MELSGQILASLFATALLAGFVDTLAGGGGLLTLPALLLTNLPPLTVLATNKVQASSGTLTASLAMMRGALVSPRRHWPLFLAALVGSTAGTIVVQHISTKSLDLAIPIVLLCIAVYVISVPKAGDIETRARISDLVYRGCIVPIIAFYDGVLGPGTGSFFSISAVALRGMRILEATALAKFLNCATNAASAAIFVFGGRVVWPIAAVMICGQVGGALLGSHFMTRGGTKYIKPLIVTVCVAMLARYAYQKYGAMFWHS